MSPSKFVTVYQAKGILQAVIVKEFLEQGGLTAALASPSRNNYLDVQVPARSVIDARSLLENKPHRSDILYPMSTM